MRDTFAENDLRSAMADPAAKAEGPGLRHSIRPRRPKTQKPMAAPVSAAASLRPLKVERADVGASAPRPDAYVPQADTAQDLLQDAPIHDDHVTADVTPDVLMLNEAMQEVANEAPRTLRPAAAAVHTGYRTDPDMPRWHELSIAEAGARRTARTAMPVVDAARDSVTVRAFDLLRTRLRQTTQEKGWTNIAITSPTKGCGTTFTAVNLALSLSRISSSRTVLMDFNLREPSVAKAFDMTPRGAMQDFLSGRTAMGDHMVRVSETLALGLNTTPDANAADTIQSDGTARTLERMRAALQPDLVIYDMPAMLAHDDISAFMPQLDGVLLVSDGSQTISRDLLECERMLEGQVPLLGVVLNRARANSIPRYN